MTAIIWADADRETLRELLPEALVLLPIGATEQHGPHLATGTDALLASTVTTRAADLADATRPLIVAPPLPFGASDHHLEFGGTLSLSPETLLAVLNDMARSIAVQGGRRLVLINGHGGNIGVCKTFAGIAPTRHHINVAYVDYWRLIGSGETNIPGHAGEFETSMVMALRPELVRARHKRDEPPTFEGGDVHLRQSWRDIDGYTDHPERADIDQGRRWMGHIVIALAARLTELARVL